MTPIAVDVGGLRIAHDTDFLLAALVGSSPTCWTWPPGMPKGRGFAADRRACPDRRARAQPGPASASASRASSVRFSVAPQQALVHPDPTGDAPLQG